MRILIVWIILIFFQNVNASGRPLDLELKLGLPNVIGAAVQYDIFNNSTTISPYFDYAYVALNAHTTKASSTGLSSRTENEKLKLNTIGLGTDFFFNPDGEGWYTGLNMDYESSEHQNKYQYSGSFEFDPDPSTDGENYSYKQDLFVLMTKIGYKWRWTYFHLGGEFGLGHTLYVSDEGKVQVFYNNGKPSPTQESMIFKSGFFPSLLIKAGFHF
jgi:hypothetical protein